MIESRFLEVISNMHLSPLDSSALKLAITRDDDLVRDALDEFKGML